MDFVSDALADGRQFRCFNIVDDLTRECPAIEVAHSLPALRIIHVLDRLALTRGLPKSIVCDNGREFAGHALDLWFTCITDAQQAVERWQMEYNEVRPHSSLGRRTPAEFAMDLKRSHNSPQRLTA